MNKPRRRRQQKVVTRPHGWVRREELPIAQTHETPEPRRRVPGGTSFLLALIVTTIAVMGAVRVHGTTEVLELGREIAELTSEQSALLEQRRRLAAERAYLRHPERIEEYARERLGMVPITPELVQTIRVMEDNQ